MHNLDRTQLEYAQEYESGETEQFLGDILGAITGGELEAPLNESQELELASELLEVSNEQELEQFLGNVFSTVGNTVGQFVRSDTGRALGGILKNAARQALPVVGRALGDWVAPGRGAAGASLAQQAGSLLGLELEGLSPQDQEFEAARQFVRFAGAATKHAAAAPPHVAAHAAARAAAVAAAQHHAPGLARTIAAGHPVGAPAHAVHRATGAPARAAAQARAAAAAAAAAAKTARVAAAHAARVAAPRPPHGAAAAVRSGGFYRPPHLAARAYHRRHVGMPVPAAAVAPTTTARPAGWAYPWYRGTPWYRQYGYTAPAPTWPTTATAARPVAAPVAYAPAYAAPAAAPAAPVAGNGWVARPGQAGRWERHGSVLVIYGA
jgi:hypothetical protein